MTTILKILAIVFLCIVIFYGATCTYANFIKKDDTIATAEPPDSEDAHYMLLIKNTLNLIYAQECNVSGTGDSEVYTLTGFWEDNGKDYVYNPGTIPLEESIYGPIELHRR